MIEGCASRRKRAMAIWVCGLIPPLTLGAPPPIEDAPLGDIAPVTVAPQGDAEFRLTRHTENYQTRVYAISAVEYAHIASHANAMFINNGLARSRSARQELNGEWLYHPIQAMTLKADGQMQYSTAYEQATAIYPEGAQDWAKVNELFVEVRAGEYLSAMLGKHRRVFGPGVFQNPMDNHNPLPSMPGAPLQREGAWLAQAALEPGWDWTWARDLRLSITWLPRYWVDKNGWPVETLSVIDYDAQRAKNGGFARIDRHWTPGRETLMTRFYGNIMGGDANIVKYSASNRESWGVSYQRYINPLVELHGEWLYSEATDSSTDSQIKGLLGARYEIDTDRGVIAEYLHQGGQPAKFPTETNAQRALMASVLNPENLVSINTPLRDYLLLSGYMRNIRDRASVTCNMVFGVAQYDAALSIRMDVKVGGLATVAVTAARNFGSAESYFGAVVPNDWRVGTELQVVF